MQTDTTYDEDVYDDGYFTGKMVRGYIMQNEEYVIEELLRHR